MLFARARARLIAILLLLLPLVLLLLVLVLLALLLTSGYLGFSLNQRPFWGCHYKAAAII